MQNPFLASARGLFQRIGRMGALHDEMCRVLDFLSIQTRSIERGMHDLLMGIVVSRFLPTGVARHCCVSIAFGLLGNPIDRTPGNMVCQSVVEIRYRRSGPQKSGFFGNLPRVIGIHPARINESTALPMMNSVGADGAEIAALVLDAAARDQEID